MEEIKKKRERAIAEKRRVAEKEVAERRQS